MEITIQTINGGTNDYVNCTFDAISEKYVKSVVKCDPIQKTTVVDESSFNIPGNTGNYNRYGFEVRDCSEDGFIEAYTLPEGDTVGFFAPLRHALYRININFNNNIRYFYYDNRCNNFPVNYCFNSGNCDGNDITIRYDLGSNKLYFRPDGPQNPDLPLDQWYELRDGENINWWVVQECDNHVYSLLTDRLFPVITSLIFTGSAIELDWHKPSVSAGFEKYEVQKAVNSGSFSTISTIYNFNTTSFTDYNIQFPKVNEPKVMHLYRIKTSYTPALQSGNKLSQLNDLSNIEKYFVGLPAKKDIGKKEDQDSLENVSNDIHIFPNPFNPITTIRLNLQKESNVVITAYNSLGKKTDILLNGKLSSGLHEVIFNGEKLSSGIYFILIRTDEFMTARKLILIK